MSRVHDMGGRLGDGVIPDKDDAVVFHQDWHAKALALTLASGTLGAWNIDISRHARERLSPTDYTRFSYYEKWMAALANLLVERGVLSAEELAGEGMPTALSPKALKAGAVSEMMHKVVPYSRNSAAKPLFKIGDRVRTLDHSPAIIPQGHTRLPRYAMGKTGTVRLCHGAHVFPDRHAHDLGEAPEPLYAVEFSAKVLWGAGERGDDSMILDLWQPYLVPA